MYRQQKALFVLLAYQIFQRSFDLVGLPPPPEEIEALGTGKLALAMRHGDVEMGSLMAGQAAAMVCEIEPAAQIIADMVSEAEAVFARLGGLGAR